MHVNATTEHAPGTCGGGGELSALPLPSHGDPVLRKAFLILQSITREITPASAALNTNVPSPTSL